MKYLKILLIVLIIGRADAAEPITNVNPLPYGAELELYEDSEGLFALKILEYYRAAVALETQLKSMGIEPTNNIAAPTIDELQDTEIRTLKRFYSQALGLLKQVQDAPDGLYHKKIDELRSKLEKMNSDNFLLKEQLHIQNLDMLSADYYRKQYRELIKQTDSLRLVIDKIYLEHQKQLWENADNIRKAYDNFQNSVSILAFSLSGNYINYNNERLDANISPAMAINFNPSPIFGLGRIVDIWAEYIYQLVESNRIGFKQNTNLEYKTDYYSTGVNLNVPLSEIMKIEHFYLGLKGGYGFFWGSTRLPNTELKSEKWQGQTFRLELGATNFSRFHFPIGVYAAYNFNNYSKDLKFPAPGQVINLGRPWTTSFQLGLRFALWQSVSTSVF